MKYSLILDDMDRHGAGCDCGVCNSNGKSYGVAIIKTPKDGEALNSALIARVYGPSEEAAFHNARLMIRSKKVDDKTT